MSQRTRSYRLCPMDSDLRGSSLRGPPWTLHTFHSWSISNISRLHHIIPSSIMKRGRTRPDPVSCQSCRSKKLKCNRIQPCSNCSARGINCSFIAPPQRETETTSTINNLPEILGRIERLESIVLQNVPVEAYSKDALNDEHRTRRQAFTSDSEDAISDIHRKRDEDSQLLESIGTRDDSLVRIL